MLTVATQQVSKKRSAPRQTGRDIGLKVSVEILTARQRPGIAESRRVLKDGTVGPPGDELDERQGKREWIVIGGCN